MQGNVDSVSGSAHADSAVVYSRFRLASHFNSIDGVRAICALVVIKEHVGWRSPLPQLFEWGFLGVDMFFVISGFLIVTLLLRERDSKQTTDLRAFYLRRTLRIFPIYYLVIFLIAVAAVASLGSTGNTWQLYKWSIPVFLIYGQDLIPISLGWMFHTWSLAMEEQFYLVWPAVEKYLRAKWVVPLILLLLVLNQICNAGLLGDAIGTLYGNADAKNLPVFLITFTPILLGVLAAHAMHDPTSGRRIAAVLRHRWTPLVVLLLAVAVCQVATELQRLPRFTVHVLFCALLLSLVVKPRNIFSPLLDSRPLVFLGRISYGIYLYHVFVLAAVEKVALALHWRLWPPASFVVVAAISVGLAALSFRYFERPIMALGRRDGKRVESVAPAAGVSRTSA